MSQTDPIINLLVLTVTLMAIVLVEIVEAQLVTVIGQAGQSLK